MNNEARAEAEKKIVTQVVKDAIAAGFVLSVDNGGDEFEVENSSNVDAVIAEMFATDSDKLVLSKNGKTIGWVHFVYGNDGYDVISDYTTNLESVLKGAVDLADEIEKAWIN